MFLCLKSATNSNFERQDITLKAVVISLKYIVCKLDVKRLGKACLTTFPYLNGGVTGVRSYSDARLIECESTHLIELE